MFLIICILVCVEVIDLGSAEAIPDDSDRVRSCTSKGTEGHKAPESFKADTRKRFTYTVRFIKTIFLSIQTLDIPTLGQIPTLLGSSAFFCSAK